MANWEESKHPRNKGGQFASKGEEGQGGKKGIDARPNETKLRDLGIDFGNMARQYLGNDKLQALAERNDVSVDDLSDDELVKSMSDDEIADMMRVNGIDDDEFDDDYDFENWDDEWTDERISEEIGDDEYVYGDITDKDKFVKLLNERNGVPLDKAKEWADRHFDEHLAYYGNSGTNYENVKKTLKEQSGIDLTKETYELLKKVFGEK